MKLDPKVIAAIATTVLETMKAEGLVQKASTKSTKKEAQVKKAPSRCSLVREWAKGINWSRMSQADVDATICKKAREENLSMYTVQAQIVRSGAKIGRKDIKDSWSK